MLEKIEKLQIATLGLLLALSLVASTRIVTKNFNNNVISVTGSAYEIVKSDSGTLNFDINVKSQTKQEAYKISQNQIEIVKKYLTEKQIKNIELKMVFHKKT